MWKFSSHIYILARRWCCLKNRQVLKCHWTCTKSLIVKELSQIGSYVNSTVTFCFAFIMTWCTMSHLPDRDKGNRHFTLSFVKVYFGVIWLVDALYSRAFYFWCSQKSPRNSEDTFRTLQDQKLPVKIEGGGKRQEFWRLQRKGKNMLIFSHGINYQKK